MRVYTTDVDASDGPVTVRTPENTTYLRADACSTGDAGDSCQMYAGQYTIHDDGCIVVEASVWDGELVRLTWLEVK